MRSPLVLCALSFPLLSLGAVAQVTTDTIAIGGPGAVGSAGGDPPTLSNGAPATAELEFRFDASNGELVLVVTNTSPIVGNDPNPLITRVFFNLPRAGAVTGLTLLSQQGSGGATPDFDMSLDLDLEARPDPNRVAGFGKLSVELSRHGIRGGIANASASNFAAPPGSWVIGPVTFRFQVQGPDLGNLSASSFARAVAEDPGYGVFVNAVVKFQAGGPNGEGSAFIGNAGNCSPSAFLQGQPCLGNTVQFVMSGAPGCEGCLLLSANPNPFMFGNVLVPIGLPVYDIGGGLLQGAFRVITVEVPQEPLLVGMTLHYALVLTRGRMTLEFSPRYEFTICP